jgi:hypothetical protein
MGGDNFQLLQALAPLLGPFYAPSIAQGLKSFDNISKQNPPNWGSLNIHAVK